MPKTKLIKIDARSPGAIYVRTRAALFRDRLESHSDFIGSLGLNADDENATVEMLHQIMLRFCQDMGNAAIFLREIQNIFEGEK